MYAYKVAGSPDADREGMLNLLKNYWAATASSLSPCLGATSQTFTSDAWGRNNWNGPCHGRFGRGIHHPGEEPTVEEFQASLQPLREACHWTEGYWEFHDGRKQEIGTKFRTLSRDIRLLAMHLLREYHGRAVKFP